MNLFKQLAKGISKTAKGLGKAAPQLILQTLNASSGGTVGMIAEVLGIGGAEPKDILNHINKNPEESMELLIEMEKTKQERLKGILSDRKDSRSQYVKMIESGDTVLAYFLPFLSLVLLAMLSYMFYVLSTPVPKGTEVNSNIHMIVGALMTSVASMIQFWYSRADKDQTQTHLINK